MDEIAPQLYDSVQALDMNCEIKRGFCISLFNITRHRPKIEVRYIILVDKNGDRHKCVLQHNRYSFGKIIPCRIVLTEKINYSIMFAMKSKYDFNERRNNV